MGQPKQFERITFRDTRDGTPRRAAVHLRDITYRSKRDRKVNTARAAVTVWPGVGPVTVDHDARKIFAGTSWTPVGDYTTRTITENEARI